MSRLISAFEIELCSYLLQNVLDACQNAGVQKVLEEDLGDDHPLTIYLELVGELDPSPSTLRAIVLSNNDLHDLDVATHELLVRQRWQVHSAVHRRRSRCVLEVRQMMSEEEAKLLSKQASIFAKALETPRLSLADGITTLIDWIIKLRQWREDLEQLANRPFAETDGQSLPKPELQGEHSATAPAAPGLPGRLPNPQSKQIADIANELRKQTPQKTWPQIAKHIAETLAASDSTSQKTYDSEQIRSLYREYYGDKALKKKMRG
ncbi:MAG: hypothetical protein JWN70_6912 [Planctomycetaceae bacterium]|nr:hypothetical protein [Planctomycetaceae bacterium]